VAANLRKCRHFRERYGLDPMPEVSRPTAQYRLAGLAHYILRPFVEARNAAPVHIFVLM
jgi:hypothetical protein